MTQPTPPGWYNAQGDPPNTQRYWDGTQWVGGPQLIGAVAAGAAGVAPGPAEAVEDKPLAWAMQPFKKYAVFQGRARRKEFWWFFLFNVIVGIVLGIVDGIAGTSSGGTGLFGGIYSLATLVPNIAVGIRRMHDIDRSGWWILLPIVNIVFWCQDGTRGPNRFGPDPQGRA